jgi:hypothetical protein
MMNSAARTNILNPILLLSILLLLSWSSLGISSKAEAMLVASNVVGGKEFGPMPDLTEKSTARLPDSHKWEKKLFDVPLLQETPPKYDFQWKHGPNFSLKDPGVLPGIQLGVEMHSFQALETVIPEGSLPKEIPVNRDRLPLVRPPSVNGPDYNGGFLRFTW